MSRFRCFLSRLFGPGKTFFWSLVKFLLLMGLLTTLLLLSSGVLTPLFDLLNRHNLSLSLGSYSLSLVSLLRAVLVFLLVLWAARLGRNFVDEQISTFTRIKQENRVLYSKIIQSVIYALSVLLGLDILGVNFKSITWFSGAVGIGIGFGLQKTAANFISGALLLFEKTLRNNDIVELDDGTTGFLRGTGARCTRLETFDGKEVLIPNEDLISRQVKHWTYSHKHVRVECSIPVGLDADLDQAHELMMAVMEGNPSCLDFPPPGCFLNEFSTHAAHFLVFFWITDVSQNYWGPRHQVLLEISRQFRQAGISFPHQQVDIHRPTQQSSRVNEQHT